MGLEMIGLQPSVSVNPLNLATVWSLVQENFHDPILNNLCLKSTIYKI